ncbi:MAG: class I tRNA ligase family protein [Clostridiales Family XIII bacterium]|nr:class I tRNA ligase family protein [Clostridiales Family XIII bacterium]
MARPEGAPGAGAGSPAGAAAAGNPAPEAGDLAPGGVNLASAAAGDPADAAEAGGDSAPGAGNPVPAEGGADAAGGVNPASASGGGDPADAAAAGGDPAPEAGDPESAEGVNPVDAALIRLATGVADKVEAHMEKFGFSHALEQIWALVGASNKYIDETAPWALAKDETQRARLETVLYNLCEALRVVSVLIHPFMHHSADEIRSQLGGGSAGPGVGVLGGGSCGGDGVAWEDAKVFGKVAVYNVVKGDALFPRIDVAKELEALEAL